MPPSSQTIRPPYPADDRYPPAPADADAWSPAVLTRAVWARRGLVVRIMLATMVVAAVILWSLPTVYSSTASIILDQRKNNVTDPSAVLSQMTIDPTAVQNQIRILSSRDLAAKVISKLNLGTDPEFNSALRRGFSPRKTISALNPLHWLRKPAPARDAAVAARDEVIDNFLSHLWVDASGLSTSIDINVTASDPEKAARIANAVADTYVSDQIEMKQDAARSADTWLNARLHDLAQQMQVEEEAIQTYKTLHNLSDTNTGTSGTSGISPLVDQQVAQINMQLLQARSDLAEKQANSEHVSALVRAGNVADVSQVVASPLISQLRGQQADLIRQEGDLAAKYGPRHPRMIAIEAQKQDLDNKIAQEATRIAGAVANDVSVARAKVTSLENSLGRVQGTAGTQNMARVRLTAMLANAASTRTTYESFVSRLRGSQNLDPMQSADARVISRAPIPDAPSSPKRGLMLAASMPMGLLLGILVVLLLERFGYLFAGETARPRAPVAQASAPAPSFAPPVHNAPAYNTPAYSAPAYAAPAPARPAPRFNPPPVLADIAGASTLQAADYVVDWPNTAYTRQVNAIVQRLAAGGARVVAVTSAEPGEGKSAIAVSLARAASNMGKRVVLIDGDARMAGAARAMRLAPPAGLNDVLSGRAPLRQALARDTRSNAYYLGGPRSQENRAPMLASANMATLLGQMRSYCDLIVVDAASVAAGPDAELVARLADASILVTSAETMHRPALSQAAAALSPYGALGVVITR